MGLYITFQNVLITLLYILPGYLCCKAGKVKPEHSSSISAILVYGLASCMQVSSFMGLKYDLSYLPGMGLFFLTTLFLQAVFVGIMALFLHKKYKDARYRILSIASVLGNVGFFGLPVIRALCPDNPEVACYSCIYCVSMNVLVFTVGIYCLTGDLKYLSLKKALINPTTIAASCGFILYLCRAGEVLPDVLKNAISLLGSATTPVCMIILGIRLATVPFLSLFRKPFVYLVCAGKLLVFPVFAFFVGRFVPGDAAFHTALFVLSATPCASIILNLAEMHGSEMEMTANCLLLSTLICIVTIPVVTGLLTMI